MKRSLCFVLTVLLLLLMGCKGNMQNETKDNATDVETLNEFEKLVETAKEDEYKISGEIIDWGCAKLEQSLKSVTDIVKARYITSKQVEPDYLHIFEVIENVRGNETPKTIYVRGMVAAFEGHSTAEIKYEKGQNYLLLLKRYTTQYIKSEQFDLIDGTFIVPLDSKSLPDIDNSRICKYDLLTYAQTNIKSEELKASVSNGTFLDAILKMTESNPYIFEGDFIDSQDLSVILNSSQYVLKIEVTGKPRSSNFFLETYYRKEYYCTVLEDIKGNFPDEFEKITISVYLTNVDDNQKCIIATQSEFGSSRCLAPSGRNSIYDISEEENIKSILASLNSEE